jgi:hypothetical protein
MIGSGRISLGIRDDRTKNVVVEEEVGVGVSQIKKN